MRNVLVLLSLYLVLIVVYVLARIYGGFGPWFLFGALICMSLYETATYRSLRRRYAMTRHVSVSRLAAGGTVEITLDVQISRSGWIPLHWLRIEDDLPPKLMVRLAQPYQMTYPWRDRQTTVRYMIDHIPRGSYRMPGAYVVSGDIFGLLNRRVYVPTAGQVIAYPETRRLMGFSVVERARPGSRVNHARSSDDAARVIGIRDYVPGDRLSRIHWPATARTGALRSKEFEHYVMNEVVLILDATKLSYGHDPLSFELALSLAGSFAEFLHQSETAFGLQVFAGQHIDLPVGRGDVNLIRVMEYLAVMQADGEEAIADTLWRLAGLPSQTTVVVIGHTLGSEWLKFAVLAKERQLKVELLITRLPNTSLSTDEAELCDALRSHGFRIRTIHSIDEIDANVALSRQRPREE
ncbi:MAG: DUF58 domain-containing protein [Firmicutes bacterium]|nr:DUF58 domain-containing protein [Bacillota bacterium]